jgi:hypothetical protein
LEAVQHARSFGLFSFDSNVRANTHARFIAEPEKGRLKKGSCMCYLGCQELPAKKSLMSTLLFF